MAKTKISKNLFKQMLANGATNLRNNYVEIDNLNVFPVPDGDTGTNMQMTMMAGVKKILEEETEYESITDISKGLAHALLNESKGNSGSILSQFFSGFHTALDLAKSDEISVSEFIKALTGGYKMAYKSVLEPVEGTILTVFRKSAQELKKAKKNLKSIDAVMNLYLKTAKKTLEETPDLLPALKDAGVVDSGGAGFIKIIEGMQLALQGHIIKDNIKEDFKIKDDFNFKDVHSYEKDIKFGYCTEFIVKLFDPKSFKKENITDILKEMGDSMVVATVEELLKVHVHTNEPGIVITLAQKYGDLQTIKVENMKLQNEELKRKAKQSEINKKYGIIAVCSGDGIGEIFKEAGADIIISGGQTMNPSTSDFVKAINKLNVEHVIIIPNNSNIIMSAEQTKQIFKDKDIKVIKTKNIGQGFAAISVFDDLSDANLNFDTMHEAIKECQTAEITYSVRDAKINNVNIKKGEFIGITNGNLEIANKDKFETFKKSLNKIYKNKQGELLTVFYGKDETKEEIKALEDHVGSNYPNIELQSLKGNQDIYPYILVLE